MTTVWRVWTREGKVFFYAAVMLRASGQWLFFEDAAGFTVAVVSSEGVAVVDILEQRPIQDVGGVQG